MIQRHVFWLMKACNIFIDDYGWFCHGFKPSFEEESSLSESLGTFMNVPKFPKQLTRKLQLWKRIIIISNAFHYPTPVTLTFPLVYIISLRWYINYRIHQPWSQLSVAFLISYLPSCAAEGNRSKRKSQRSKRKGRPLTSQLPPLYMLKTHHPRDPNNPPEIMYQNRNFQKLLPSSRVG